MRLVMNEGHEHFVYGKKVRAGEVFEAPDLEAKVWIQFGRARAASSRIATKVVTAEAESKPLEEKSHSKRYNRRDMRAEDE